jgi:3-deoxy-D-arabino-heptulosonate 7-phosphate (DAHP) synthase
MTVMAVVTIKAEPVGATGSREKLMREVRMKARDLLAGDADRVLVVYGPQDASLYYESGKTLPAKSS